MAVVTHILRQARRLADYVVFLYMDELVKSGTAQDRFEHPQQPRTHAYIGGEFS